MRLPATLATLLATYPSSLTPQVMAGDLCEIAQFQSAHAVAISPYDDAVATWLLASAEGIVQIYEPRCGVWDLAAELHGSPGFGRCLAFGGHLLAVANPDERRVYLYERTEPTWELVDVLYAPPALPGPPDGFGLSLAMNPNGSIVAVGSPFDDEAGLNAGAVNIFTKTEGGTVWTQTKKLIGEADEAYFGNAVALDGVGGEALAVLRPFAAYTFFYDNGLWSQDGKVVPSLSTTHIFTSIDIEYDKLVLGGEEPGRVTIFQRTGGPGGGPWEEKQTLNELYPEMGFGRLVAMVGNRILVSSFEGLHVFDSSSSPLSWTQTAQIDVVGFLAAEGHLVASGGYDSTPGGGLDGVVRLYSSNPYDCRRRSLSAPLPAGVKHY